MKIPKNARTFDDRDFEFLKSRGLEYITAMSREIWTDYNSHDPGITILEALCYAITDLGNRIQLPIRDLLAERDPQSSAAFPTAQKILTTAPVTSSDYRKCFIDLPGVKNAFIRPYTGWEMHTHCLKTVDDSDDNPRGKLSYQAKPEEDHYRLKDTFHLKGLNRILFEPDLSVQMLEGEEKEKRLEEIKTSVTEAYHARRNLCEDAAEVKEAGTLGILVCGDMEIETTADAAEVLAEFLFRVQQYLSPPVNRYTLKQFLDENIPTEKIFDGPVLRNGFIKDDELEKADFKTSIHLSDLIRIAKETPGIAKIRSLRMRQCPGEGEDCSGSEEVENEWTICFPPDHEKILKVKLEPSISRTNLFKDVVPAAANGEQVREKLLQKQIRFEEQMELSCEDLLPQKGRPLGVGNYSTVQNDLPALYGTGPNGLSENLPTERHAKALQLKGFLFFFDQVLATYFSHLREIGTLLSPDAGSKTYFQNDVERLKDVEKLVKNMPGFSSELEELIGEMDLGEARKNQFLDHLMARFSENMSEYAFLLLEEQGLDLESERVWHKSAILDEYPEMSYRRFQAFDYRNNETKIWDSEDVQGIKQRICRLLGIRDYSRRDLARYRYQLTEEEPWEWSLLDDEEETVLKSMKTYESENQAAAGLWDAIRLAADDSSYQIEPAGGKHTVFLLNRMDDKVAQSDEEFETEDVAFEWIENLSEKMEQKQFDEGMFLFEHILLRPDRDSEEQFMEICMDPECTQCPPQDPYSLRLTIVLPGWSGRFANMYYRTFAENLIRSEIPAHILARICWIGHDKRLSSSERDPKKPQMVQLQEVYKQWLTHKMEHPDQQKENEYLKPLADTLHNLETIYPGGRLHDCDDSDKQSALIVLGRSTIGEINEEKKNNE